MAIDDATLNNAINALRNLQIQLEGNVQDEPEDFEMLTGQMIPNREDQVCFLTSF